jgi:hypothetical protein
MKNVWKAVMMMLVLGDVGYAQNFNWRSMGEEQRNVVQMHAGFDYGATVQVGYARSFTLVRPVIAGLEYSFPM